MITVKSDDLSFVRAGSDFMGICWSAHVTGYDFKKGERYLIERSDGTTFEVAVEKRQRMDGQQCWHLVDADGALVLGL